VGLTVLDAGVIIAILNAADVHHARARGSWRQSGTEGISSSLPVSAYAEVLVAPYRHGVGATVAVDEFLDSVPVSVEPATREIAHRAAELRARHGNRLRLPDSLVVATAIVLEADGVVTTDARWPDFGVLVEVIGGSPG